MLSDEDKCVYLDTQSSGRPLRIRTDLSAIFKWRVTIISVIIHLKKYSAYADFMTISTYIILYIMIRNSHILFDYARKLFMRAQDRWFYKRVFVFAYRRISTKTKNGIQKLIFTALASIMLSVTNVSVHKR